MPFLPKVCPGPGHPRKACGQPLHLAILCVLMAKPGTVESGHPRTWQKLDRMTETFLALCTLGVCVYTCVVMSRKRNLQAKFYQGPMSSDYSCYSHEESKNIIVPIFFSSLRPGTLNNFFFFFFSDCAKSIRS